MWVWETLHKHLQGTDGKPHKRCCFTAPHHVHSCQTLSYVLSELLHFWPKSLNRASGRNIHVSTAAAPVAHSASGLLIWCCRWWQDEMLCSEKKQKKNPNTCSRNWLIGYWCDKNNCLVVPQTIQNFFVENPVRVANDSFGTLSKFSETFLRGSNNLMSQSILRCKISIHNSRTVKSSY